MSTYASCKRVLPPAQYRPSASNTHTYTRSTVTAAAAYGQRDGARLHYFPAISKYVLLGGWWNPPNDWSVSSYDTNEVWTSSDLSTWTLELAHDDNPPTSGAGARWKPKHTFLSYVHDGKLWVMGGDQYEVPMLSDVWNSEDAVTWTRVAESSPWGYGQGVWNPIPGYYGGLMHVMGGNRESVDGQGVQDWPSTAEHWTSADGVTWTQLADMPFVRSMVMDAVTLDGLMFIIGGNEGTANTRDTQSDTWAWNGSTWYQISADSAGVWEGRDFISVGAYDDKLWVATGTTNSLVYTGGLYWSRNLGRTWERSTAPWAGSHADALTTGPDGLVMASGNGQGKNVFKVVGA